MASINTSDFKNGMAIDLGSDGLFRIEAFQHVKPGKGGAFVRTTLKNMRTGAVVDRTFRAGEKMERAFIEKRDQTLLYKDVDGFVVMDSESFEQATVSADSMGDASNYIKDGDVVTLQKYGDEIVGVDLPAAVELSIAETEPGVQGDRVSGARKPATLETGLVLQVPLFCNVGRRDQGRHQIWRLSDQSLTVTGNSRDPDAIGGPRESRERAAELAYEQEVRAWDVDELLSSLVLPVSELTESLLRDAELFRTKADELIAKASRGWSLDRMPLFDLVLMRMAVAELLNRKTPTGVVVSETLLLIGRYSTEESTKFVNGVLGTIARDVRA